MSYVYVDRLEQPNVTYSYEGNNTVGTITIGGVKITARARMPLIGTQEHNNMLIVMSGDTSKHPRFTGVPDGLYRAMGGLPLVLEGEIAGDGLEAHFKRHGAKLVKPNVKIREPGYLDQALG